MKNKATARTADVDASSAYETIDFGLLFGGGLDFNVANKTGLLFSSRQVMVLVYLIFGNRQRL